MQLWSLQSCGNTPSSSIFKGDYVRQAHLPSPSRIPGTANVPGASKTALFENLKINSDLHGTSNYFPPMHLHNSESEFDLEALVQEYIDNDSKYDTQKKKQEKRKASGYEKHLQSIQMLLSECTSSERRIQSIMNLLSATINCEDLPCSFGKVECKGGCIHNVFVTGLRKLGYDAAVCNSVWSQFGRLPAGEYQYMDVTMNSDPGTERLVIDIDFASQFEIARSTESYMNILKVLPVVFVGSAEKLSRILYAMSKAVMLSMSENAMAVPPWRTLAYMEFKWLSPSPTPLLNPPRLSHYVVADNPRKNQCVRKLMHLKLSMNNVYSFISEHDNSSTSSRQQPRGSKSKP